MAADPLDLDRIDQEIRINEHRSRAEEAVGGEMTAWTSKDCPPAMEEHFWNSVADYEEAPSTSHFEQLTEAGLKLPPPETMNDEELTAKLWEAIEFLGRMRVFITGTDHLSDRELYTHLWVDTFHEEIPAMPFSEDAAWHIDLLGSGSEEDTYLYMKYFADEDYRRNWLKQFPDYEMPAHIDPPYDRDRLLPADRR